MAGPWFTVAENLNDENQNQWQQLGTVWISNGAEDSIGRVEIQLEMVNANEND